MLLFKIQCCFLKMKLMIQLLNSPECYPHSNELLSAVEMKKERRTHTDSSFTI